MTGEELLELDGSAGGGQLLRTALALSMVTRQPFRMQNVRGDRSTPGLKPQHRTGVRAAAEVCDATVSGAEQGSETLTFRPGTLNGSDSRSDSDLASDPGPRRVEVEIGTAGSVLLLFDALLPLAAELDRPLAVTTTGGTDVKWSPTLAHYRRVKLPLVREAGVFAAVESARTGFYPAGGGEATLWLAPSELSPVEVTDRGSLAGVRLHSKASADLADSDVGERQATNAVERLHGGLREDVERVEGNSRDQRGEVPITETTISSVETASPGSAVTVALDYEETTAGFDALGEQGKSADEVGVEAAEAALAFHKGTGAVDRHTADQLVVFLALAGGRVAIPEATDHVRTGVDLVNEFGFSVELAEGDSRDPPTLTAPGPE
jgi:RNA 3'-terminal phosphate cyclase (ATP)